jgi:hypothetical protein
LPNPDASILPLSGPNSADRAQGLHPNAMHLDRLQRGLERVTGQQKEND